jgi:hypothetical protein
MFSTNHFPPHTALLLSETMAKQTLPLSISAAVLSSAIVYNQQCSLIKSVLIVLSCAYLPSCFDGSENDGTRARPWLGRSAFSHFLWTKLLGLPLSEVRWNAKDFKNKEQQYIFSSHPHGVASLHHIGTMLLPIVSEPNKSFEEISPVANRRELAASFVVKCPLYRDLSLTAGAVDADRKVCGVSAVSSSKLFRLIFNTPPLTHTGSNTDVKRRQDTRYFSWRRARTASQ